MLSFKTVLFVQAKDQMSPAEKALDDTAALIKPMKPQLDELKQLLQNGGQQAEEAQSNADDAADEATSASEVKILLELLSCTVV